MANVGTVQSVTGLVRAIAEDGTERILSVGDRVAENEKIITGDGVIVIAFTDGTVLDLGSNSSIVLNDDVLNQGGEQAAQSRSEAENEVAALQEAIANNPNFDPNALPATAAGPAAGGTDGNNGHTVVSVDYLNPKAPVEAGFDTVGISQEFLQTDEELPPVIDSPPEADPVLTTADSSDQLPQGLQSALSELGLGGGEGNWLQNGTNGSAIQKNFAVNAGDVISFDWFFDADDYEPFNDFSFVVIDGVAFELADISDVGSYNTTGWNTFTYEVTSSGNISIGFGAMNTGDSGVSTYLLVDNLQIDGALVEGFNTDLTEWTTLGTAGILPNHDEGGIPTEDGSLVQITSSGAGNTASLALLLDISEDDISSMAASYNGGILDIAFYKQLTVDGLVGDSDFDIADLGGSDAETSLESLVFTLTSDPTPFGSLILVTEGGDTSLLSIGDTFTSADTVWWFATEDDVADFSEEQEAFNLPNVTFDYSVTDEGGESADATVTIQFPLVTPEPLVTLAENNEGPVIIDEDDSGDVTVSAETNPGSHLTTIVITGFEDYVTADWLDLGSLPGAVFDEGTSTLTISGLSGTDYSGAFEVTPPADDDRDAGTLTATATAVNDLNPSLSVDAVDSADVITDAVADEVSVNITVVDGDDENASFQIDENGTVTVTATFGDVLDGSETHTVEVTIPDGFSVGDDSSADSVTENLDGTTTLIYTVNGTSLNDSFTVTNVDAEDGTSSFEAEATAEETTFAGAEPDLSDNIETDDDSTSPSVSSTKGVTLDDVTVDEDEAITYTASVDSAPVGSNLLITLDNGVVITILAGEFTGSSDPQPAQGDDIYLDSESFDIAITSTSGGGYDSLDISDTATVTINDTIDDTTLTLNDVTVDEGTGTATMGASLDHTPTDGDIVFTLSNGATVTFTTAYVAGTTVQSTAFAIQGDDVYLDGATTTITADSYTGGAEFENVVHTDTGDVIVEDTIDTTTVTLTATESVQVSGAIIYTATVGATPVATALVLTIVDENSLELGTITINPGETEGTLEVVAPDSADDSYDVTMSDNGGGSYEDLDTTDGASTLVNEVPISTALLVTNTNVEVQTLEVVIASENGSNTTGVVEPTEIQGQEGSALEFAEPVIFEEGETYTVTIEHVSGPAIILTDLSVSDANGSVVDIYEGNAKLETGDGPGGNTNPDGYIFNVTIGEAFGSDPTDYSVSEAIGYEVLNDVLTLDTETNTNEFVLDFSELSINGGQDLFGNVETVDISGKGTSEDNTIFISAQDVLDLGTGGDNTITITGDVGDVVNLVDLDNGSGAGTWAQVGATETYTYTGGTVDATAIIDNALTVNLNTTTLDGI